MMRPKAVILLSGGMDSAVCLHTAHAQGFELFAITFQYGQRHRSEIQAAEKIAQTMPLIHWITLDLPLARIGGSALTDPNLATPKEGLRTGIPITYVPARNTIFLSLALAWAETVNAQDLFIGVNAVDYSGYPDCRPAYIEAFETLANLATRTGVSGQPIRIRAPLLHLSKAQIIQKGVELGVDFSLTRSCYDPTPDDLACGVCDACRLRLAGFATAGITDSAPYIS